MKTLANKIDKFCKLASYSNLASYSDLCKLLYASLANSDRGSYLVFLDLLEQSAPELRQYLSNSASPYEKLLLLHNIFPNICKLKLQTSKLHATRQSIEFANSFGIIGLARGFLYYDNCHISVPECISFEKPLSITGGKIDYILKFKNSQFLVYLDDLSTLIRTTDPLFKEIKQIFDSIMPKAIDDFHKLEALLDTPPM